jgi:flavin reductase (DIM6/NTAB) family NADH-FMN oxidoreductase RutF
MSLRHHQKTMQAMKQATRVARRVLFGSEDFSQQRPLGLHAPQEEVTVWLEGSGQPRDVTQRHFMACSAPFLIGIGGDASTSVLGQPQENLSLRFEGRAPARTLGSIELALDRTVDVDENPIALFRIRASQNHCLPALQLWAHHLHYAYLRWRSPNSDVTMASRDVHAMCAFYICPRPTGIVSVSDGSRANVFPMNLMGRAGANSFCFALKTVTPVVSLVQRASRLALCTIPIEKASVAYGLGKNHNRDSIDVGELPFRTPLSPKLQLPLPEFSLGVVELVVESSTNLGSHTLFVARIIHEEQWANTPQFFLIHGMYDLWRRKNMIAPKHGLHSIPIA